MNITSVGFGASDTTSVMNRTYMLLALTLIPTIFGAVVGVKTNILTSLSGLGSIGVMIAMIVVSVGLIIGISCFKDSPVGVGLLMVFTFVMGVMLSISLERVLKIPNGSMLIAGAFGGTVTILFGTMILNKFLNRNLGWMGKGLFICLIALLIASVLVMFMPTKMGLILISVATLILFSAYLLYDINQVVHGGETSAVMATLSIYLDLFNIFTSLLNLFGITSDD